MLLTNSGNATISWEAQIQLQSLVPDHILMQLLIYGPLTTVILLSFSSQENPQYFNQFFTVGSVINMPLLMIIIAILHKALLMVILLMLLPLIRPIKIGFQEYPEIGGIHFSQGILLLQLCFRQSLLQLCFRHSAPIVTTRQKLLFVSLC